MQQAEAAAAEGEGEEFHDFRDREGREVSSWRQVLLMVKVEAEVEVEEAAEAEEAYG